MESAAVGPEAGKEARPAAERRTVAAEDAGTPRAIASDDWDVVSEICCALGPRQLDWFRSNEFVTPWLDVHARPALKLEALLTRVVDRPFEAGLRTRLGILDEAVGLFVEHYRRHTFPDPLLRTEDWRFFEWDDRVRAAENGSGGDRWSGRAAHLHRLANEVALAYEGLIAAVSRNQNVRQRIRSRA